MDRVITTIAIHFEHDVVLARQRARQIAGLLGFDSWDQVRVATAVSEIARNAFHYARDGDVRFVVTTDTPPLFRIVVTDKGPGIPHLEDILMGRYVSSTGMGMGIVGARRLMDEFEIQSKDGVGTAVVLGKSMPKRKPGLSDEAMGELVAQLARQPPQDPFEELQRQNQELLATLSELQRQKSELAQLNKELEDTNRGVVALYAELDERADYLRRISELKSQFLSNMTHEFRTPVNSILSLGRILLDCVDGPLNEEQQRQVRFIQKAAEDLYELVNDLLDLAKVEAGKVTIRPAEFQVGDLFGALRGMLRPLLAHTSRVSLIFDEPGEVPPLNTDESKVSQILRNLVSNALKYTERGEVRVRATVDAPGWVAFSVSDTGIGVASADLVRIFEEFTQIEGLHQRGKPGTGLGLPLSRKLAELLGGTLTVTSEPGKGSTFTLRVPVQYRGAAEVNSAPELSTELDSDKGVCRDVKDSILVIDNDPASRYILSGFLANTGFRLLEAETGQGGIDLARERKPALIFLDLAMPGLDGFKVLDLLKHDPATADIPVAIHTSVLLKPADRKRLENRTVAIIEKSHEDRQSSARRIREILRFAQISGTARPDEVVTHANI